MSANRTPAAPVLPWALAAALLAAILIAWSPRYWPTTVGIAGLTAVAFAWAISSRKIFIPPEMILVVPIGAWGFLQIYLHTTAIPALTLRNSLVWAMGAVAFFLASQILRGRRNLHPFLDLMLWAVTALAVTSMLQSAMVQAPGGPVKVFGIFSAESSVTGTMFYKNHFAALMELAAPIALWKVTRGRVVLGSVCFAIMFAAAITSASRAGTILMLAELAAFFALTIAGRKMPVKTGLVMVATLLLFVAGAALVAGTENIWTRLEEPNAYELRGKLADSTFSMIAEKPLTGFGLGTWRAIYPRFALFDDTLIANEAHNDLAQWASDGGIPFLTLILALVAWIAARALKTVWGLGVLSLICHCYVDYALRAPSLTFIWFVLAGALVSRADPAPDAPQLPAK